MKPITGSIAILMVSLFSCKPYGNSENSRLMQQAQLLIEQKLDSALVLLDAVNVARFSDAERAEYTLMRIQAKDKAGLDISADTAIFKVSDDYVAGSDVEKAALACFYAGRVWQEQGNASAAMQAYLDAERMANSLKNQERLKGLIVFFIGNLY